MDWSAVWMELPKAVGTLMGAVVGGFLAITGGVLGGFAGQYFTHRYTRARETEKLLREKAEDLIHTLCQIRHNTVVLYNGLLRDMVLSKPSQQRVVGSVSLKSFNEPLAKDNIRRLPEPSEYQAVIHGIYFDSQRADTLQRLYFPSVQRCYKAHNDAFSPLIEWLRKYIALQEEDFLHWPEQFRTDSAEAQVKLLEPYDTAHAEIVEAVARTVSPYREISGA